MSCPVKLHFFWRFCFLKSDLTIFFHFFADFRALCVCLQPQQPVKRFLKPFHSSRFHKNKFAFINFAVFGIFTSWKILENLFQVVSRVIFILLQIGECFYLTIILCFCRKKMTFGALTWIWQILCQHTILAENNFSLKLSLHPSQVFTAKK